MEYYSAIKRNTFESVLMRWMSLEPIIQCEVSQKEKDEYSILTHVWNLEECYQRNYLQGSNRDRYREQIDEHGEGEEGECGLYGESNMETYITMCKIDSQWEFTA